MEYKILSVFKGDIRNMCSVGAIVRMMVKGGCLPVRGSTRMSWKYDDMRCMCGDVESEKHELLDCNFYKDA